MDVPGIEAKGNVELLFRAGGIGSESGEGRCKKGENAVPELCGSWPGNDAEVGGGGGLLGFGTGSEPQRYPARDVQLPKDRMRIRISYPLLCGNTP